MITCNICDEITFQSNVRNSLTDYQLQQRVSWINMNLLLLLLFSSTILTRVNGYSKYTKVSRVSLRSRFKLGVFSNSDKIWKVAKFKIQRYTLWGYLSGIVIVHCKEFHTGYTLEQEMANLCKTCKNVLKSPYSCKHC